MYKFFLYYFVLSTWAKQFGRELAVAISITQHFSCSYLPNFSILLTAALANKASSHLLVHSLLESPVLLVSPQEVNFSSWSSFSPLHCHKIHPLAVNEWKARNCNRDKRQHNLSNLGELLGSEWQCPGTTHIQNSQRVYAEKICGMFWNSFHGLLQ